MPLEDNSFSQPLGEDKERAKGVALTLPAEFPSEKIEIALSSIDVSNYYPEIKKDLFLLLESQHALLTISLDLFGINVERNSRVTLPTIPINALNEECKTLQTFLFVKALSSYGSGILNQPSEIIGEIQFINDSLTLIYDLSEVLIKEVIGEKAGISRIDKRVKIHQKTYHLFQSVKRV